MHLWDEELTLADAQERTLWHEAMSRSLFDNEQLQVRAGCTPGRPVVHMLATLASPIPSSAAAWPLPCPCLAPPLPLLCPCLPPHQKQTLVTGAAAARVCGAG